PYSLLFLFSFTYPAASEISTLSLHDALPISGGGARLLRNLLVIFEIALSLILLIGAGLLVQTFVRLSDVRLGFDPHNILTAKVTRQMTDGFNTPSHAPFFDQVIDRLKTLPVVVAAGAGTRAPLSSCIGGSFPIR